MQRIVTLEQLSLNQYVPQSQKMLLKATCHILKPKAEYDPLQYKSQRNEERMADGKEKPLHGQFLRHAEVETSNLSWTWLKKNLRRRQKDC